MYEAIKNFVMRRLGYPRIKCYITSEQLDDCIWEAIDWYFEYRELESKWAYLGGTPGQAQYDLPAEIVPKMIKEVVFKPSDPLLTLTGVTEDVYMMYYLQRGKSSSFILDYWLTLANYEEYIRVLGNQPSYQIVEGNKIILDPVPATGFTLGISYSYLPSEYVIENTRWIRMYSLACAKEVEGQIRGKFTTFSAGSGDIGLNGDALKAEGVQEKQQLLEENITKDPMAGMAMG